MPPFFSLADWMKKTLTKGLYLLVNRKKPIKTSPGIVIFNGRNYHSYKKSPTDLEDILKKKLGKQDKMTEQFLLNKCGICLPLYFI